MMRAKYDSFTILCRQPTILPDASRPTSTCCAVSGRSLSFMMSSSRLQIILTGWPATALAKSVVWNNSSASIGSPEPPLTPPCSGEGSWLRKATKKPDDLSEAFLSQMPCLVKNSRSPPRTSKPGPVDDRLRLHDFRFQTGDKRDDLTALRFRHFKLVHSRA